MKFIHIKGARENNLKNISLKLPKEKLIVLTGLSGSGKSTLAFDTLYAEGQRRYLESLSSYARQFIDREKKPDVDKIDGLIPAIAINQKTTSKNPRSTVGTITEIYDYLRLLYARLGIQYCPTCGDKISSMDDADIIESVLKFKEDSKIIILAPIIKDKKGSFNEKIEELRSKGYVRAQINGVQVRLDETINLSKTKRHTIKVIIDRTKINQDNRSRIAEGIERALKESYGEVEIEVDGEIKYFSKHLACLKCKISFEELDHLSFSFNSPRGACTKCHGLGVSYRIDYRKVLDQNMPIKKSIINSPYISNKAFYALVFTAMCDEEDINLNDNFYDLSERHKNIILHGSLTKLKINWKDEQLETTWEGLFNILKRALKENQNEFLEECTCEECKGYRLKPSMLSVKVASKGIAEILEMPIEECNKFFMDERNFSYLNESESFIASTILKETRQRLNFLDEVGLGYLSLHRNADSISGGESQRIRIASQIGSGLTGVMYVLDEPSIGLHERDTLRLIKTMRSLQEKGNTLVVVEHDKETIKSADFIVDIGPGAGEFGGEVSFSGTYDELLQSSSLTAEYLSGKKQINHRFDRSQNHFIHLKNINIHNVKNENISIPLVNLTCITGVSGSGKSSIILHTLLPIAKEVINIRNPSDKINGVSHEGFNLLDKVIYLDQSAIGRTPRSNPATYTGIMDDLRELFASTKEAKIRGYSISRFSFNVRGGRCEECMGEGRKIISMHFLPDIEVTCEKCRGKRYNNLTLDITYNDKNIAEVLDMSVQKALEFFSKVPKLFQKLKVLNDIGLGYIKLGQNATTLSGGEAQRVKIAKELCKKETGKTLYILDEPTTGLHLEDIKKLVEILHYLVELNNTVVVIEHNLDLIKNADYIIDIGPEGGDKGGKIINVGTPSEFIQHQTIGYTAKYLAKELTLYSYNNETKVK